jgi:hypothetical protein
MNITGGNLLVLTKIVNLYPTVKVASKVTLELIPEKILAEIWFTRAQEKIVRKNFVIWTAWQLTSEFTITMLSDVFTVNGLVQGMTNILFIWIRIFEIKSRNVNFVLKLTMKPHLYLDILNSCMSGMQKNIAVIIVTLKLIPIILWIITSEFANKITVTQIKILFFKILQPVLSLPFDNETIYSETDFLIQNQRKNLTNSKC